MRKLAPIESRVLALLLVALVLALAWLVLVQWWLVAPLRSTDRTITSLRDSQQRYATIVSQRDMLHQRLAALSRGHLNNASALLAGSDANAATAGLMQRVVDAVHAHTRAGACTVTRKMPLPASTVGQSGYREINAVINMRCTMSALTAVLYELGHGKLYVFTHSFNAYGNADINANSSGNGSRDRGGGKQLLRVQLAVSGYMRARTAGDEP